jgi:hypothetical protein
VKFLHTVFKYGRSDDGLAFTSRKMQPFYLYLVVLLAALLKYTFDLRHNGDELLKDYVSQPSSYPSV